MIPEIVLTKITFEIFSIITVKEVAIAAPIAPNFGIKMKFSVKLINNEMKVILPINFSCPVIIKKTPVHPVDMRC